MTFDADKLVHFQPFFGLPVRSLTISASAIYCHAELNLYRCKSTFSALNYCSKIFFKSLSYLYEVVLTNFSANFWTLRNF